MDVSEIVLQAWLANFEDVLHIVEPIALIIFTGVIARSTCEQKKVNIMRFNHDLINQREYIQESLFIALHDIVRDNEISFETMYRVLMAERDSHIYFDDEVALYVKSFKDELDKHQKAVVSLQNQNITNEDRKFYKELQYETETWLLRQSPVIKEKFSPFFKLNQNPSVIGGSLPKRRFTMSKSRSS